MPSQNQMNGTAPAPARPTARRRLRPFALGALLGCYCLFVFLAMDFVYSFFVKTGDPRIPVAEYHHGLVANFSGYDRFREVPYPFYTNSLGFRDSAVRTIPFQSSRRRILLIGDSFVEGVGMPFESSFAGLLADAAANRPNPIEIVNAGVVSYSPVLYLAKIKYLLELGLRFDEVIVFIDISDIHDEATSYFCEDIDPSYRKNCNIVCVDYCASRSSNWFKRHFIITDTTRAIAKRKLQSMGVGLESGNIDLYPKRAGWTLGGPDLEPAYQPLGVEGGIRRAKENMQRLADLLAARQIPLTVAVYPWPFQIIRHDQNSRQVTIWQEFCASNCKTFIDLFPAFFSEAEARADWTTYLFWPADVHFSETGHKLVFQAVARRLRLQ